MLARVSTGPSEALAGIRSALRAIDAEVPIIQERSLSSFVAASVREEQFRTLLVALFAVSAVLLAAVGLGGTIFRLVTQRHREWGVRAALGATPRRLLAAIVLRGLVPATLGVGLGLVVALGAGRFLAPFMFGVSTWDPATYFAVACLIVSIGGIASYVPARRVLRLNPRDALVSD